MSEAEKLLAQLEAQTALARKALEDEAEGAFARAVVLAAYDADRLLALVSSW